MIILIAGIVLFLGTHTLTTLRETRASLIARVGAGPYKGLYSLTAGVGFALIVWGFHRYRDEDWVQLWSPPIWTRHITIVLMWFAFVALAASGGPPGRATPPSRIRGWLRHPMLVAVKIWALAHLLANGDLGGLLLFGSFLAWAVWDRIAVKRRGDIGAPRSARFTPADAIALAGGSVAYVAMIFLHPWLIGVPVIGS
jgi:uncharacterized membrane protein